MPDKNGKRQPINKPTKFVEHLELLNLLPENLDESLKEFSRILENGRIQREKEKTEGKQPEQYEKNSFDYAKEAKAFYVKFRQSLPETLQKALPPVHHWQAGERILNRFAVEREEIDIIISERAREVEFEKDFEQWLADEPASDTPREVLFDTFRREMEHLGKTRERFNAERYEFKLPGFSLIMQTPSVNDRLAFHRAFAGTERIGFNGFHTMPIVKDGKLRADARGLIAILLEQERNNSAPIEVDRLRRCDGCDKFIYAYKGNQEFCSRKCYVTKYRSEVRAGSNKLKLLEKDLRKANSRLENLKSRLDAENGLIAEQAKRVEEIEKQIKAEKENNGTL
jgi:hypothetical protein